MENRHQGAPYGLYIHIPFCVRKCPYCDFYSVTSRGIISDYLAAMEQEMGQVKGAGYHFDTVHLGGGTPSILAPDQIGQVLSQTRAFFSFEQDAEVTVEVNPGTVDTDFFHAFLDAGGTRVNVGVQSFDNRCLAFLGRIHTADEGRDALSWARKAGVKNLGIDLMYGLPEQKRKDWLRDLEAAVSYGPEHLSCYMLTYEEGTPLARRRREGKVRPLGGAQVRELFETTVGFLSGKGYEQYEISNFSRGGVFPSRHNQKYWTHGPYVGLGPSAHSFSERRRRWNVGDLGRYVKRLSKGQSPVQGEEVLTPGQLMLEAFFLGLRTTAGVDFHGLEQRFGHAFHASFSRFCQKLEAQELEGLVEISGTRCRLTLEGQVFSDTVNALFADGMGETDNGQD